MKHRVHEILLVASPYDAFILEEEGGLTEQIMTEYIGMNFNYAPRVTRASTSVSAMQHLSKHKFDLVIVMLRIEDTDPISLGKSIKKHYPLMPVILLAFDETEIKQLSQKISPSSINRVFIWSGDASVFPAIIKYVEDRKNAEERAYMIGCTLNGLLSKLPGHEEFCDCTYYYEEKLGFSAEDTEQLCGI